MPQPKAFLVIIVLSPQKSGKVITDSSPFLPHVTSLFTPYFPSLSFSSFPLRLFFPHLIFPNPLRRSYRFDLLFDFLQQDSSRKASWFLSGLKGMDWAMEKISSTFGYYYYLHTNMKKLKRNTEQLNDREEDINEDVNYEVQRSRKRRRVEVELWQKDVRRIANDVQTLERQVQEASWMNVFKCAELGKRVVETNEEVEKLHKNGGFSNGLLIDDPTCGHAIPTAESLVETTAVRNKEKIWNFLMDDAVRKIGVCGMGGIGKTTTMKDINDQLLYVYSNFSDVIWVTVSREFDIKNLQRQIAKKLNINLSDYEDELHLVSEIHYMLSQNKRYVLILDNLWEAFPLEKVGIPEPTRDNGCKLVLTTQLVEVCTKMNCRIVEMELLREEEALNLFMINVKEHQTVLTPEVEEIAKEVAKNCARLPLAIVTMAGCMRGVNDIREWRNARNAQQLMGKEERLFKQLEFSYSRLKNEQEKHCFLYCALFPENIDIPREKLILHWIAEGLICQMSSREAMFGMGHAILNKLIKTFLLVKGVRFGQECVSMHDLIRDMALKITSTSPLFMVRTGLMELQSDQGEEQQSDQGEEQQSDQGEENAIVYDIIPNEYHQGAKLLREEESDVFATKVPMQKPQYEATLGTSDLLGKDESIIATGRRGGLSVDLDRLNNERKIVGLRPGVGLLMAPFSIKEFITKMTDKLPHSLGKESSESILPAGKELENAPLLFFRDMSALHVLDLSYTSINSLPQSISRLSALQKLILRGCDFLMELPPKIGELTNLEVIDLEGTEIIYLPKEIAKLIKLSCLKVSFYRYANNYRESKHIDTIIPSASLSNLSRLNELSIDVNPDGDWWDVEVRTIIDDLCSLRELRTLKLYLPTIELLEELVRDSPSLICPALTHFRFIVGRQVERFLSRLPREVEEEFNNLEKSEKGLKYVNGEGIPIEIIEVLKHASAFFLERHWTVNNLSQFGLPNLDKLKFCFLVECNELRTIIDANQFYQEGDCEGDDSNKSEEMVLGSLQYLSIHYMKNMESICQGSVGKGCLYNLKFLALHTCLSLTTIFTVGMLRNLVNLEELIVEDCTKISSLVDLKNSDSKSGHFLPCLKKILLLELPKLVSISNGLCIAPKLERMVIFYCPKLVKLSTMEVSGKDLKVIKGENEWWGALKWHESDLSSDHQDYLASVFVPLRRDGDLMAQFTKD